MIIETPRRKDTKQSLSLSYGFIILLAGTWRLGVLAFNDRLPTTDHYRPLDDIEGVGGEGNLLEGFFGGFAYGGFFALKGAG